MLIVFLLLLRFVMYFLVLVMYWIAIGPISFFYLRGAILSCNLMGQNMNIPISTVIHAKETHIKIKLLKSQNYHLLNIQYHDFTSSNLALECGMGIRSSYVNVYIVFFYSYFESPSSQLMWSSFSLMSFFL